MPQTTNFNVSPYFDDFATAKEYYRILFKPKIAIQARELNQIQAMYQNQIERFGKNIFKDGDIISGAGITFYDTLHYVRLNDQDTNNNLVNLQLLANTVAVSQVTNLEAKVVSYNFGSVAQYPNTNRVYIQYLNTGNNGAIVFGANEPLNFYQSPLSANVLINTIYSISNTAVNTYPESIGYGISVAPGIIFQKGFFVKVDPQFYIASDVVNLGNTFLGFQTNEKIITSDTDPSLLDNALGYPNYSAPGADRLQLTANITSINSNTLSSSNNFTAIVEYINGIPTMKQQYTQYAVLGDTMAKHMYEQSGSFIIKPFAIDTMPSANASNFFLNVSPGIGYAEGYRVETINSVPIEIPRGNAIENTDAQLITAGYANYIFVQELSGAFNFETLDQIAIYDTFQQSITNRNLSASAPIGTIVGYCNVRSLQGDTGQYGTPNAEFNLYIFNIQMLSGKSFSLNAKSFVDLNTNAKCDIILNGSGQAILINSQQKAAIFNFGKSSVKTLKDKNNNINTQYVFRNQSNSTIAINGTVSLSFTTSHAGGTNEFNYGVGNLNDLESYTFTVIAGANTYTTPITGNVASSNSSNILSGTGTNFNTNFSIGDFVIVGTNVANVYNTSVSDVRRITAISNATSLIVDANFSQTGNFSASKYVPQGYVFPLSQLLVGNRGISITGATTATITVGTSSAGTLINTIPVIVQHDVLRYNTVPAKKIINKNVLVGINTSNNSGGVLGPWILGVADVHMLNNVYVGSSISNTNPDLLSMFYFDTGMKDTHYDIAKLYLKPGATLPANANTLLINIDCFTPSYASGIGFFTIDSYPIDDTNISNTSAIQTYNIPTYMSESGGSYVLRDCVDYRPYLNNSASITSNVSNITINPVYNSNNFVIDPNGTYFPTPATNFESSVQYYLGNKVVVYIDKNNVINYKSGAPSETPVNPNINYDGMAIATVNVPPYPSLTNQEQATVIAENKISKNIIRDTSKQIQSTIVTNRRYTMADIGKLDSRISRMEYYAALNMLEQSTANLQVPDANGLNRFKNGIFVDAFTDHTGGDVSNLEYKIAIDIKNHVARPFFSEERVSLLLNTSLSTNVVQTGRLVTLAYSPTLLTQQPYATAYRSAVSVQNKWNGHVSLSPSYDAAVNKQSAAAVNVTLDSSSVWQQFANSPWGTNYGQWRQSVSVANTISTATSTDTAGDVTTYTNSVSATTTTNSRSIDQLSISTTQNQYNLGNYVTDVSIQPFLQTREIAFIAYGLRPNITVHAFFDGKLVDQFCVPGTVNSAITDGTDDHIVTKNVPYGSLSNALITDSNGNLAGKFLLPPNWFRTGERNFELADSVSLVLGSASITTSAITTFVGSSLSVTSQNLTLTTINPEIGITSTGQQNTQLSYNNNTTVSTVYAPPPPPPPVIQYPSYDPSSSYEFFFNSSGGGAGGGDPLAQGFLINADLGVSGTFLTSLNVYFYQKSFDPTHGVTIFVCETLNGYPNTSKIIPFSRTHLTWSQVNVSPYATLATPFTFVSPLFLKNNTHYAFIIFPDASDPDYLVWTATLGDNDITYGTQVSTKPTVDTAFYSSNDSTWSAIQDTYVKFDISRAQFINGTGTAVFKNKPTDYITVNNVTNANSQYSIGVGDIAFSAANSTVSTANLFYNGMVSFYNPANSEIHLRNSIGQLNNFAATGLSTLQFHRFSNTTTFIPNTSTYIASANVQSINNPLLNAIVPQFASIEPAGTQLAHTFNGISNTYSSIGKIYPVAPETETEIFDQAMMVSSRSNEINSYGSNNSITIKTTFSSQNNFVSPAIDMIRANILAIGNEIDLTSVSLVNEYKNTGNVQTKYISKTVVLDSGQDAEDIMVYLSAYYPQNSSILVYVKFLSGSDPAQISDKTWTQLNIDSVSNYSDYKNVNDFHELKYTIPATIGINTPSTSAYKDTVNGLSYTDVNGTIYHTFKSFAIKMVLLSDTSATVPRINNLRAIALQI